MPAFNEYRESPATTYKLCSETAAGRKQWKVPICLSRQVALQIPRSIGLELAGVEMTRDGYVKVNERLETTAPGVWAVGDVTGGPMFTHISFDDFRVIRDNINGGNHVTTGRQVPFCMFTDPELARVGLSERQARIGASRTVCSRSPWKQCPERTRFLRHEDS